MMAQIKNWLAERNLRERIILISGFSVALLILIYSLFWSPLTERVSDLRQNIQDLQREFSWIQHITPRFNAMKKSQQQKRLPVKNLLSETEKTLAKFGLTDYLQHVQQLQQDEVSFTLKNVPFDKLMDCLQQLLQHNKIQVISFTSQPGATLGTAKVELVLSAG